MSNLVAHAPPNGTVSSPSPEIQKATEDLIGVALKTALNFAKRNRDSRGNAYISANPLADVNWPKNNNPARPVGDVEFCRALHGVADQLRPEFRLALDLAYATGHRIGAILRLRWSDVSAEATGTAPLGSIHWRAEFDKTRTAHTTPMNELSKLSLVAERRRQASIGAGWVFPSINDPSQPLERRLVNRWLRRAERLAGIQHAKGRGWHSLRRGFASALRHMSDVDVAAAGGWKKNSASLKECYQHSDAAGVLNAVSRWTN